MSADDNNHASEIEIEFRTLKFDFNLYDVFDEISNVRGILRVAVLPVKITKTENAATSKPIFRMAAVILSSFLNKGERGEPDRQPIDFTKIPDESKIDITETLGITSEPYNIFVTTGFKPYYALRYKATVNKAEVVRNKFDANGDPIVIVSMSTSSLSYSYHTEQNSR